jgi:O-antigen/teichoic acid export membrane protein
LNSIKDYIYNNKILKETFWAFFSKGMSFILIYALQLYMIRVMSVEQWGLWSGFYSLLHILFMLSFFGLNRASSTYIAKYNKTSHLRTVLRNSFQLRVIFNSIYIAIIAAIGWLLMDLLDKDHYTKNFYMSLPLIFMFAFQENIISMFVGLHRNRFQVNMKLTEHISKLIFVVGLFAISINIEYIIIAYTVSAVITTASGIWLLYSKFYKELEDDRSKKFFSDMTRLALTLILITLGQSIIVDMDTLMMWKMKGEFETGQYSTAKQTLRYLPQITLAMAMGIMPIFAKLSEENKQELRKKFYFVFRINFSIFFVLVALIVLLSPYFVPIIFGEVYRPSIIIFQVMAPYLLFQTSALFSGVALDYMGRAKQRVYVVMLAMVINLVLNILLIPEYSGVGAAIATICAYIPYALLNYLEVRKALH